MIGFNFSLEPNSFSTLKRHPQKIFPTKILGKLCSVGIIIPYHLQKLKQFYKPNILTSIEIAQRDSGITYDTLHFGLCICFEQSTELHLHDSNMELEQGLKHLIREFGVVIIKNAFLDSESRDLGHRAKFPHLKFHYDRTQLQPTVYSVYTRNPFDVEQKQPRIASTLFAPNIVAYLQSLKEQNYRGVSNKGVLSNYDLFFDENMENVTSNIVVEHKWNEPEGIGELSMIDNRTVLHASFYRDGLHPGYRIGVSYCS
jgi:hypothetical protein